MDRVVFGEKQVESMWKMSESIINRSIDLIPHIQMEMDIAICMYCALNRSALKNLELGHNGQKTKQHDAA